MFCLSVRLDFGVYYKSFCDERVGQVVQRHTGCREHYNFQRCNLIKNTEKVLNFKQFNLIVLLKGHIYRRSIWHDDENYMGNRSIERRPVLNYIRHLRRPIHHAGKATQFTNRYNRNNKLIKQTRSKRVLQR
jgi:hypothetical protein